MLKSKMRALAAGIAVTSISGAGAGIGTIFNGFLTAVSNNPDIEEKLFTFALLGFALTEAIALFGLMVTFLLLFA
jgi:F0F1-type ATP synthase membrane subunit c/vacuolar-type H+-ATPase subunit K